MARGGLRRAFRSRLLGGGSWEFAPAPQTVLGAPGEAWERGKQSQKPFIGILRVSNPARPRVAASRERVLRGPGQEIDPGCEA